MLPALVHVNAVAGPFSSVGIIIFASQGYFSIFNIERGT
jgi:hypothetical protein